MTEAPTTPVPAPETAEGSNPRLWGWQTALSLAAAAGLLIFLVSQVDVRAVWREIQRCDVGLALAGLLAHYFTYVVRGARWRRVLRHVQKKAGTWMFTLLVFFYNFIDNLVPARLGDVYGAHLARINLGLSGSAALGSLVFIRMIDAWVVMGLAMWSSFMVFRDRLPTEIVWALGFGGVVAVVATGLLIGFAVLGKSPTSRLPEAITRRIASFREGMWPRRGEFLRIGVLTAVIWFLEILWIYLLTRAFHMTLTPPEVIFVATISLLASAVPLTPSGAGFVELSLYGCLTAVGATPTIATSITVLNRFMDYWLHLALGIVVWAFRGRLGLKTWRKPPAQTGPAGAPAS